MDPARGGLLRAGPRTRRPAIHRRDRRLRRGLHRAPPPRPPRLRAGGAGGGSPRSGGRGDFDGAGWPGLFEAKGPPVLWEPPYAPTGEPAPDRLWRNNRDGTFTDVAPALGVADPLAGWTGAWFDIDGD